MSALIPAGHAERVGRRIECAAPILDAPQFVQAGDVALDGGCRVDALLEAGGGVIDKFADACVEDEKLPPLSPGAAIWRVLSSTLPLNGTGCIGGSGRTPMSSTGKLA
jgi:hypothetical protein